MLLPDFAPINETFNTVSPAIDRWLGQNASSEMASALRTRAETDRPRIMVYGVYNAGKSTLLNALLGSEQAAMADRPETAEIKGYDWRGYTLLDTPGIDAPIEHEAVTESSLNRSDVILFVVAAGGVAAEGETWNALIDILRRGRRVLLVINDKMSLERDGEEYVVVIDSARVHLQNFAEKAGIKNILDKVDLCVVNARSALKGRMENKSALVRNSGLDELERKLFQFLEDCDYSVVCRSAARDVLDLIDKASAVLEERAGNEESRCVDELDRTVRKSRERVVSKARARLDTIIGSTRPRVLAYCRNKVSDPNVPESDLTEIADGMEQDLWSHMEAQIAEEYRGLDADVEKLAELIKSKISRTDINLEAGEEQKSSVFGKHFSELGQNLSSGLSALPAEQSTTILKSVLMFGKDVSKTNVGAVLKPLYHMKGAVRLGAVAAKYGKFLGPALTAISAVIGFGVAIHNELKARREAERQARAIADAADNFLSKYRQDAMLWISQQAQQAFEVLENNVRVRLKEISQENTALMEDRTLFLTAKQTLEQYNY